MNSLHENACFSVVSVFRGVPPHLRPLPGLLLASCWPLAGFLLASCCPLPGLLLASWFLLSSSFPTRISLENRFFKRFSKLVNSLHENTCFSMVSVFRGVPELASCWPLAGLFLLAGFLLASSWLLAGLLPASPPEHPARKSVFQRVLKTGEFSS